MYLFQKVKDFKEIYCRKIVTIRKSICKKSNSKCTKRGRHTHDINAISKYLEEQ